MAVIARNFYRGNVLLDLFRKSFFSWVVVATLSIYEPILAKPPDKVISQMEALAKVNAALIVCFESPEFNRLSNEKALKVHELSGNADQIIEFIENKFADNNAYAAYMVASIGYKEDAGFRAGLAGRYSRRCAPQLISDADKNIKAIHSRIRSLVK